MATPIVSVADVVVGESDLFAYFVFALSAPSSTPVSVGYFTSSGSANGSSDFTHTGSQTVTFAPGQTTLTVPVRVAITDNVTAEQSESFYLNLFVPSGSSVLLGKSLATATIVDNDGTAGTPAVTISDAVVDEQAGRAYFTATLDRPSNDSDRKINRVLSRNSIGSAHAAFR